MTDNTTTPVVEDDASTSYIGKSIAEQLPTTIPLTRAQKKAKIKYKALGKPNEYMRRCKTLKTEEIGGVIYTTYLHFTKGLRKRRV